MGGYGIFISAAYISVFLGLLYMTVRYLGLHKRLQKTIKDR